MIMRVESNSEARQYIAKLREQAWGNGVAGATDEASAKIAFKQLSTLIASDTSLRVTNVPGNRTNEVGQIVGGTGIPEIDNPASLKNIRENLEKLLLELQLDNDERMAKMQQEILESEKGTLHARHNDMSAQIKKNREAIDSAAAKQNFMKIFGWAMFAVSVLVTAVSCGAAIGAAVAANAAVTATAAAVSAAATTTAATTTTATAATTAATQVATQAALEAVKAAAKEAIKQMVKSLILNTIGLGLSTTMQIAQETGQMEEWTKSLAESIQGGNCSKAEAQMWAQIILGVGTLLLSMGTSMGGAATAAKASASSVMAVNKATQAGAQLATTLSMKIAAKMTQFASSGVGKALMIGMNVGMTGGSAVGQGISIKANYKAGMTQADTTDLQTALKLIEQIISETQEELELILEQEQALMSKMFTIISSEMETEDEISRNLGSMA